MAETVQLKAVITAKDNATKEMKKVGTSVGDLAKGFAVGQLAVDAFKSSVRFAVGFLKDSIKEFSKQEQADARLRAGLKNTTQEWERGFKELSDYASALQQTTTFADEQTISAQAMLSTFMLNSDQIKKLTPSILDMAAALEKTEGNEADLQQISILLGKAIGGEDVEGLAGALRRVGVVMTKAQTEILKTGTMEQRLDAITTIVSQNFGGFASETAQTYTGRLKIMQNAISDVKEKFGEALLKGLSPFISKLTEWINKPETQKFFDDLGQSIEDIMDNLYKTATDTLPIVGNAFKEAFSAASLAVNGTNNKIKAMNADFSTTDILASPLIGLVLGVAKAIEVASGFLIIFKNVAREISNVIEGWMGIFDRVFQKVDALRQKIGGVMSSINNVVTGEAFRAGGGIVQAGVPVTVGERGAETFVPSQNGRIYRQDQMPMGEISVNFNNVNVRNDMDLDTIITAVKQTLRRDSLNARLGI